MTGHETCLSTCLLTLILALLSGNVLAQKTEDDLERAARELREALGAKKGKPVSEELKRAQRQWAFYLKRIDREVKRQDDLLAKGGQPLRDAVNEYAGRAQSGGDAVDHYLAGRLYGRVDDLAKARDHFEQSTMIDPWFYWGYHGLGTYFAVRKMWDSGVSHYRKALSLNPDYIPSLRGLAMCQARNGNLTSAGNTLKKLLERDPEDVEAVEAMAHLLVDQVRYEEAVGYFQKALQLKPESLDSRYYLARCYERSDRADLALQSYEELVTLHPGSWRGFLAMARILNARGQLHKSADLLEKALTALPKENSPVDPAQVEASILKMRSGPPVVKVNPDRKSAEDWIYIMVNSAEVERRQRAARILLRSPRNTQALNKAFLHVLAKDKDPVMRMHSLAWIRMWWPRGELASKRLMDVFRTLLKITKDSGVQSQLAWLMALSESPAAVPSLVDKLQRVKTAHAFREMHRALNTLTYAYIDVELPWEFGFEDMDRIKERWSQWYEKNRRDYRRYELKKK